MNRRPVALWGLLLATLVVVFGWSLGSGPVPVRAFTMVHILLRRPGDPVMRTIILQLRLPRAINAMLVGAGLSVAGVVFQALLQNPLAEPFTLGIAGGAGFTVTFLAAFFPALYALPLAAPLGGFAGALVSTLLVFMLAQRHRLSNLALILCGTVLSFLFGSLTYLNYAFGRVQTMQSAVTWLMGDLGAVQSSLTSWAWLAMLPPLALIFWHGQTLDLLGLGEERALCLGVPVQRMRYWLLAASALMTGLCVSVAGVIGFVGFLIPHAARYLTGARHYRLLPVSAVLGAIFLLVTDTLARSIIQPLELPVGALTGLAGAAFFLLYYLRRAPEVGA